MPDPTIPDAALAADAHQRHRAAATAGSSPATVYVSAQLPQGAAYVKIHVVARAQREDGLLGLSPAAVAPLVRAISAGQGRDRDNGGEVRH